MVVSARQSPQPGPLTDTPGAAVRRWAALLAVGVAVAVGVGLRFWTSSPLWLDEALTVNVASLPVGEIPEALERDGLPPLHYLLLSGWMAVFGDGDQAVRALSGLFSVATLPLALLAGRRLGGPRAGIAAVVVVALNPFAIRYATEARMYSMIMFLVLAGLLLVHHAWGGTRRPSVFVGIAAVTATLAYSHYWTFWLLAAVGTVLVVAAVRGPARTRAAPRRILAAMAAGGVLFVPWLPTFLTQVAHTGTPWARPSRPSEVVALTLRDLGGSSIPEGALLGLGVLTGCFVLGVLGRARGPRRIDLELRWNPGEPTHMVAAVVVLTLAYGSVISLLGASAFATRYASVVVPLVLVVAAVGVTRFERTVLRVGLLVVLAGLGTAASVQQATTARTQAAEVAAAIVAGPPGDVDPGPRPLVVYCPDQLGPGVHRLLPADIFDQLVFPELEPTAVDAPERIDWYDYTQRQESIAPDDVATAVLDRAGPANTIWVVFSAAYRTPGERCTQFVDALGAQRPGQAMVVAAPDRFFESANLIVYPPAEP